MRCKRRGERGIFVTGTDELTEIRQFVEVLPGRRRETTPFAKLYLSQTKELVKDKEIRPDTLRVYFYCLANVRYENVIDISQKEVASDLGMHKSNVSKCFKQLIEKKIFFLDRKIGQTKTYRLNVFYAYRGNVKGREHLRRVQSVQQMMDDDFDGIVQNQNLY